MAPFEVKMEGTQPNNVIYYTTSDSKVITPRSSFGLISNNYVDGIGILTFNQDVTYIPSYCFQNCSSLTSISLPESIISIERSAFQNCSGLTGNLNLPEGVITIGDYAFQRCSSLTGNLTIPGGVTSIGNYAFDGCSGVTGNLTISEGVTSIGNGAFFGCSGFTGNLIIPEGVTSIGNSAFYGCSGFTGNLIIPKGVASIGDNAFYGCSGFTGNLIIPEGVTSIGNSAFYGCSGFTGNLTIQEGVTTIGNRAFEGCSGFTGSLSIPPGVTTIGSSAFSGCSGFTGNLTIQEGVTTIGNRAFEGCSGFTGNLIIPEGVTSIEGGAFAYCRSLESISLPNSLDLIGSSAFSDCSCLSRIDIPNGVLQISSGAFYNCSSLTNVTIPESITRIFYRSFSNCSNLTSIIIPEGVTSIDQEAFSNCSNLTSIIIPEGVTSIGKKAFMDCSSLTRIDVRAINPPEGAIDMFSNTGFCPIYIPSGSEDAYLNADYWKHYALRMRIEGSNSPIAYCSSDYSQDGEVVQLQQASVGRGINIILMGDGFLDKDMTPGGKYENKMREAMEQFFSYEPYYSLRNRFNIYAVKIVSGNDIYFNENSNRALSYEHGDTISFRRAKCFDYASIVPNPYNQPLKIGVVFNSDVTISRSFCTMDLLEGHCCAFVLGLNENIINHELGGHGFAFLTDEYVEKAGYYSEQSSLDDKYNRYGYGANVDWRSNPNEVRWSRFLKDPRYGYEGLGVYEGGYLYAHGVYRATENSMMRYNDTPFNAPSREQIYKMIMKYSEGDGWEYDYEEFVKADERGRMEAAEGLGPWKSPRRDTRSMAQENNHHPPVLVDQSVKEVGFDKDGNVILVR
jgi:hypothetical protein